MASPLQPPVSQACRRARAAKHWRIVLFSWMLAGVCAVCTRQFQFAMYSQSAGGLARGATSMRSSRRLVDDTDSRYITAQDQIHYSSRKEGYAKMLIGLIMGSVAATAMSIPLLAMKGEFTADSLQAFMGQTEFADKREASNVAFVAQSSPQPLARESLKESLPAVVDGENWDWAYVEDDVADVVPPPPEDEPIVKQSDDDIFAGL